MLDLNIGLLSEEFLAGINVGRIDIDADNIGTSEAIDDWEEWMPGRSSNIQDIFDGFVGFSPLSN